MKTLGIIGGTSYHSTLQYYKEINRLVSKRIGSDQNPELIIYSINIDVMRRQIEDEINAKYLEVAQKLESAGAKAIIIAANTPHMAVNYVQPKITIPFLHIGDAVAKEAQKLKLKKLLLLGNKPTMTKAFLKEYLREKYAIEVIIPDQTNIEQSHHYVSKELTQGVFTQAAKTYYKQLIENYHKQADGVILGCTELPLLLNNEKLSLQAIATTNLHINLAVSFIIT